MASISAGVGINAETVDKDKNTDGEQEQLEQEMDEWNGVWQHLINLHKRKPCSYNHLYDENMYDYNHALLLFKEPLGKLFLTEQMSLKKGLKQFSKDGAEAVAIGLRQLKYLDVIDPVNRKDLDYHMYLKEKQDGRTKVRGCTGGWKQYL
jgi:hypothetical protein